MKQEYNSFFEKITSDRSDRQLLDGAIREAEKRMRAKKSGRKAIVVPIAAALSLVIGAVGVAAAFGYQHLTTIFGGNENLLNEIQTNVFEDSDGHVKVMVEQLISDGRYVHAAVHYQAIDEVGRKWLSGEPFGVGVNASHQIIHIQCDDKDYGGSSSYGSHENKAYRTETDRYFYLVSDFYDAVWDNDKLSGYMQYPMTDGSRRADIAIESTMEIKRFNVAGDERCSKYLTPTYIEISPLSYALYAHDDHGLVASELLPSGGYSMYTTIPFEEYNTEILQKDKYLVMNNGERILLANGSGGSRENGEFLWQTAEIFDTTSYYNCIEKEYTVMIDFEAVAGLEIDGVYYDLIAE